MSDAMFSCECCGQSSPRRTGYRCAGGHLCEQCFDEREDGPGTRGIPPASPPATAPTGKKASR